MIDARAPHLRQIGLALGAALLVTSCIAAPLAAQAPRRASDQEQLVTVTHARVPSAAFHATRDVYVWLPDAEGTPGGRYPVLVLLDEEDRNQFRSALANIQFLIDRHRIPPIMVVGVPFTDARTHELSPAATGSTAQRYPAAGGADVTMRFVVDELLPWTDAHYPTLPMRLLAGHSLGALFALYTMAARPDVFHAVIAMSPSLYWNDDSLAPTLAARIVADTADVRSLFVTSGLLEEPIDLSVSRFATRMTALLDSTHSRHLRFARKQYAPDDHSMTPLPSLVDGLRMAFQPIVVPVDSVFNQLSSAHVQDSTVILAAVHDLESRYATNAAAMHITAPFPEHSLDYLGYYAYVTKHYGLAVQLFRENTARYPRSWTAHESLGEGLLAVGDTTNAVAELRIAIKTCIRHDDNNYQSALDVMRALHRSVTPGGK